MIVVGYQGIGKSTLARVPMVGRYNVFIDLESSCFSVDGKKADNWHKSYCQTAECLSKQGYIVLVSSHEAVVKQLENSSETVVLVYPSINIEFEWVNKLYNRAMHSKLEKDYKAHLRARNRYAEDIQALEASNIKHKIVLNSLRYDLRSDLFALERNLK